MDNRNRKIIQQIARRKIVEFGRRAETEAARRRQIRLIESSLEITDELKQKRDIDLPNLGGKERL